MRRPVFLALPLVLAVAPLDAQRVLRRGFEPAITPFLGVTAYGDRVALIDDGGTFDFGNALALGVQVDRPWTRRTAFMGTLALTPFTDVYARSGDNLGEVANTVIAAVDVGVAGRFKPSAPVFGYVGAGVLGATRRAGLRDGTAIEPRVSYGVGMDFLRREEYGFRLMWIGHSTRPQPVNDPDGVSGARTSAFDWTLVLGGRITRGRDTTAEAGR